MEIIINKNRNMIRFSIWLFVIILNTPLVFSQKKDVGTSVYFPYSMGIGVKLGDPTGISIKKYYRRRAVELIAGKSFYWSHHNYYYWTSPGNMYKGNKVEMVYNYSSPIAIQVRYLFFKGISELRLFRWYFGPGVQYRYSTIYYNYTTPDGKFFTNGRKSDFGVGIDGVVGIEYTFVEAPISLGIDANLYVELADQLFLPLVQGGVTIRYNFK